MRTGTALLPQLAADGAARAYPHDGYWRDVGTVEAYWQAHLDFLASEPPLDLDDPAWPAVTDDGARIGRDARIGGDGDIALVGQAADVPDGHRVPAGGRWPEPDR